MQADDPLLDGSPFTCTECKSDEGRPAPMLRDEAWAKIAGPRENLCSACFWKRAKERGVRLELASLKPCPVNLFHRPASWFDYFTRCKHDPPVDIAARSVSTFSMHSSSCGQTAESWCGSTSQRLDGGM